MQSECSNCNRKQNTISMVEWHNKLYCVDCYYLIRYKEGGNIIAGCN